MDTRYSVYNLTGLAPIETNHAARPLERVGATPDDAPGLFHPDNPLLWGLGIAAITLGLAAASGSVRLGKATVKVSAGKA